MHPCTDKTIPTLNPNPITCIPNDKKSVGVYRDFITKLLFLRDSNDIYIQEWLNIIQSNVKILA